jgi:hypothetical protein
MSAPSLQPVVAAPAADRRFAITIRTAEGHVDTYMRLGGNSFDHSIEAMELGGIGAGVIVHQVVEGS